MRCRRRSKLAAPVQDDPLQKPTGRDAFLTTVGGVEYTVRPLYAYDLYGLVVSKHDADTWWDWIHAAASDKLNVTDLCVVWGASARSGSLPRHQFLERRIRRATRAHPPMRPGRAFDMTSLSNNHLLTDDPAIAKVLKQMRVGDQVHFRGYLAEYSHHHGFAFFRGTSITRLDTGNGACETVFATDAEIVRPGNPGWRFTFWAAAAAFLRGHRRLGRAMPYRVEPHSMAEKKRPRRTPQRILETSLALFNRFGEPHITTADIADEMNISPGNLYYHFRNKDDIIGGLYEALEAEIVPLLALPDGRAASVEDLWLLLHLLFERMREYRFFYRDLDEITSRNRKIASRFADLMRRGENTVIELCRGLVAAGEMTRIGARDRRARVQRHARVHLLDVVPADRRAPRRRRSERPMNPPSASIARPTRCWRSSRRIWSATGAC